VVLCADFDAGCHPISACGFQILTSGLLINSPSREGLLAIGAPEKLFSFFLQFPEGHDGTPEIGSAGYLASNNNWRFSICLIEGIGSAWHVSLTDSSVEASWLTGYEEYQELVCVFFCSARLSSGCVVPRCSRGNVGSSAPHPLLPESHPDPTLLQETSLCNRLSCCCYPESTRNPYVLLKLQRQTSQRHLSTFPTCNQEQHFACTLTPTYLSRLVSQPILAI
jgi:uncharacterized membrane protein